MPRRNRRRPIRRPRISFFSCREKRKEPGRSKWEIDLALELSKVYYVKTNDRTLLRPLEVDIVATDRFKEVFLIEVNGPVHYTPAVYGERSHRKSHRNDLRKLHKALVKGYKILVIPAQNRMPKLWEVLEGLEVLSRASGSFSLLFERRGKVSVPLG